MLTGSFQFGVALTLDTRADSMCRRRVSKSIACVGVYKVPCFDDLSGQEIRSELAIQVVSQYACQVAG